jgi:hypothetical protein
MCAPSSSRLTLAYLENGQDLRSVFIPSTLRERFLKIAGPNTLRNLETCGILCGVLVLSLQISIDISVTMPS